MLLPQCGSKRLYPPAPDNEVEYAFSNLCLLLSLVTNAVIIGSATNLLSNMDAGAVAKKAQLDSINGYMHFRKVLWGACGKHSVAVISSGIHCFRDGDNVGDVLELNVHEPRTLSTRQARTLRKSKVFNRG